MQDGTIQEGAAGTIIIDYRGPAFLQDFAEKNGINWFDRVTKIRFGGTADPTLLDMSQFHNLELVKSDSWAMSLKSLNDLDKWKTISESPVTDEVKKTFSDCQLKITSSKNDLSTTIKIDQSFSCKIPAIQQ